MTQYFSPCHAGCKLTNSTLNKKGQKLNLYWECGCVAQDSQGNADPWWIKAAEEEEDGSAQSPPPPAAAISTDGALPTIAGENRDEYYKIQGSKCINICYCSGAVDGYCPSSCTGQFFAVLGLFFVMGLFQSAARVPNFLVMMRVIDVQDKAAGMTISVWALSLFAFLPGPIVIGSLIDSACLIWGDKCGDRTSCLVYDTDAMRYYMSGYACVAMVLAWLCDVGVWYYVPEDLDLYDDPEDRDSVDGGKGSMDKFNDSGIDTHEDFTEIELNDLKS